MTSLPVACSDASRDAGEALTGTAPVAAVWLLVELGGAWAPKPLASEGLSPALRARLDRFVREVPRSRIGWIRPVETTSGTTTVLLARTDPGSTALFRGVLASADDLVECPLEAILGGQIDPRFSRVQAPLYLVCTHGQRDRCCGRLGVPVARALVGAAHDRVFQTTHVGGHRFAANVVVLPEGYVYGRIEPADAGALVAAHDGRRVFDLGRLRGRSCYEPAAQAAEAALRTREGERAIDAYRAADGFEEPDGAHTVRFGRRDGATTSVRVWHETLAMSAPPSCGEAPEPLERWSATLAPGSTPPG